MKVTGVFMKNMKAYEQGKRYIVNKGSTRSSKTYSILQLLYTIAMWNTDQPLVISIVSESMPHLKKGCIRDFLDIVKTKGEWNEKSWNATDKIYKVNNSLIEFFSADNAAKVHGPSRNILYVNECINLDYETYRQLAIRTTKTIFLDCNPNYDFWLDHKVLTRPEAQLIHSTYKDNNFLSAAQVHEIESNRGDENWWRVYGEGLTGVRQGSFIRNWDVVDRMPETYKKRWIGIDFGFTNDPTSIVDIRLHEGELWIDELLFAKGYDNLMIADVLKENDIPAHTQVVADSAEPKSIKEIAARGWKVEGAQKGRDSIASGIAILNRYAKHITRRSSNIIDEYHNYRWKTNDMGDATNTPIDKYNHSIDAQRYVCLNYLAERGSRLSYSVIGGNRADRRISYRN